MKKNTLASSPLKSYVTLVPEESREDVATSVIKTISIQTKLSFPNGRFFRENKLFRTNLQLILLNSVTIIFLT